MSRPLRIEFPDAWYHVMNRGRRGEAVYHDKTDYQAFINLLIESTDMWDLRVSAYCLMPNHYHLLVQTPDANISRCMRHINGVYTQRFNGRHRTDGQLFKGRYKSILVSGDEYLLQLVRYIHRNPVKAGLADKPDNYPWSSHNAYLSAAKKWDWLNKPFVYSFLSKNRKQWISMYRSFMASGDDETVDAIIEGKKWPAVIGTRSFIDWVKGEFYALKKLEDVPDSRSLAPSVESIIDTLCRFYAVEPDALFRSRRGVFNEPRNVAIFLVRTLRHDTLKDIANQFQMKKYSSVGSTMERITRLKKTDEELNQRIDLLMNQIKKS